jgi:hypothetical protein
MASDSFGAFEAIANSSIKLARVAPEEELAMDVCSLRGRASVGVERDFEPLQTRARQLDSNYDLAAE